jgi:hypothetical protein
MVAEDKIKGQMSTLTTALPDIETPYVVTGYGGSEAAPLCDFDKLLERTKMSSVRWHRELTARLDALDNVLTQAEGLDVETATTIRAHAISFAERVEEQLEIIRAECRFPFRDHVSDRAGCNRRVPAAVRRSKMKIHQLHLHYRKIYLAASDRVGRFMHRHRNVQP